MPIENKRPKRSLKSLYDEMAALVPYSDVLTWTLEQIAKKNPDMIGLLTKLGVGEVDCYLCIHIYK